MPRASLLPCPECRAIQVIRVDGTHVSLPILPTPENPEPARPHMKRDRFCAWCGCEFVTLEQVLEIKHHGDPEKIKLAIECPELVAPSAHRDMPGQKHLWPV